MKTHIQAPILRLTLCFGIGIVLHEYLFAGALYLISLLTLVFVFSIFFARKMPGRKLEAIVALTISFLFVALGTVFYEAHSFTPVEVRLDDRECKVSVIAGSAISGRKKTPFGYQAWVALAAIQQDSVWVRAKGKFQLNIEPELDSLFEAGDELMIRAYIKPVLKTGKSYPEYLLGKGIRHYAYAKAMRVKKQDPSLKGKIKEYQQSLSEKIGRQIEDTVLASLAQAMFLGDKRNLTKESRAIFASAGLSHMLAISGMHVGIIFICLNLLLLPLNLMQHGKRIKYLILLVFLFLYMLLTGSSPAVVRAVLMLATVLVCRIANQKYSLLNLLALSGWIQMLYDPEVVFQVGFQLSYVAVFGLLTFMPVYQAYTATPYKWLNTLNTWIGVSIIATCCTAPLSIFYFEQFPVYFLLSNILASTIAFCLILSGFLWMLCMWIPFLGEAFATACEFFLWVLNLIATEISKLPYAVLSEFFGNQIGFQIICFELLFAVLLLFLPHLYFRNKQLTY